MHMHLPCRCLCKRKDDKLVVKQIVFMTELVFTGRNNNSFM